MLWGSSLQFIAYNSRECLVELFRDCYNDQRDVKSVLDMITRRAGYIKLFGQTLIVVLDWIENKKHRQAVVPPVESKKNKTDGTAET